eukprot:CAMPEP_0183365418 /NCGR_PEP_ID=MMETSP0164_2-20130417/84699_1 /TAXON_ID=221442 /ORGANISM="Coccolithus pelagicus ssp braarudi, Strain PLY182g" /LENGTH=92 /DNA_ID=CAMNT_0025540953 /DNA_START=41 /DNA_END=316 /DNA_ORIENTATION=+
MRWQEGYRNTQLPFFKAAENPNSKTNPYSKTISQTPMGALGAVGGAFLFVFGGYTWIKGGFSEERKVKEVGIPMSYDVASRAPGLPPREDAW